MNKFLKLFAGWINLLMCLLHLLVAARYFYVGEIKGISFLGFAIAYGYLQIAWMHKKKQSKQELEELKQLYYSPCMDCKYYHGQHNVNCAVHPDWKRKENCSDWVKKNN